MTDGIPSLTVSGCSLVDLVASKLKMSGVVPCPELPGVKVNKGNLGHSFDFLVLLRREDGYLKANTIELTFYPMCF